MHKIVNERLRIPMVKIKDHLILLLSWYSIGRTNKTKLDGR